MPTTTKPLTFEAWLKQIDAICWRRFDCSYEDLPDVCYSDMYEDGVSPSAAASLAYRGGYE